MNKLTKEQNRQEAMNVTLKRIYAKYNNTELSNETLAAYHNKSTAVTSEPNRTIFVSPIYKADGGYCTDTVSVEYKDREYTVLRTSLSKSQSKKIPVGRWGRIRVKLSTLKISN
jgi:hypothetical protein